MATDVAKGVARASVVVKRAAERAGERCAKFVQTSQPALGTACFNLFYRYTCCICLYSNSVDCLTSGAVCDFC